MSSSALILIPVVLGPLLHYLFRVRPRRKKDSQLAAMQHQLKVGDRVATTSGLLGMVVGLTPDTVELQPCPGSNLTHHYERDAIKQLQAPYQSKTASTSTDVELRSVPTAQAGS